MTRVRVVVVVVVSLEAAGAIVSGAAVVSGEVAGAVVAGTVSVGAGAGVGVEVVGVALVSGWLCCAASPVGTSAMAAIAAIVLNRGVLCVIVKKIRPPRDRLPVYDEAHRFAR